LAHGNPPGMCSLANAAPAIVICAALAACGRTSDSLARGTGGASAGGSSSRDLCDNGSRATGGGSGGEREPCNQPDPDSSELFHPEQLATGLTVQSVQERSLDFESDTADQILAATDDTVLLS